MDSPIRVYLLAGSRLLREALTRILSKRPEMLVVGDGAPSPEIMRQIVESECEVLVVDPVATALSSLQFLNDLRQPLPEMKVVMIEMEETEEIFLKAVRAGVSGYLLKDASAMEVLAAIRAVSQGEAVCPPRLCLTLCKTVKQEGGFRLNFTLTVNLGLTRREQELIPLIGEGLTNKEIACRLNLSEQTVKNHVHRILRKVGARDRMSVLEKVQVQSLTL